MFNEIGLNKYLKIFWKINNEKLKFEKEIYLEIINFTCIIHKI